MKHLNPKITTLTLTIVLLAVCLASAAQAATTTVKAAASASEPKIGDTLTVTISITDVTNLYGVDVELNWNPNVLSLIEAKSKLGVESNPGGILHESGTDTLLVVEDSASQTTGTYILIASSTGASPAFSGSGTIATLTFNVTSAGSSGLTLQSELADKPATGQTANFIQHTDTADNITTIVPEFSSIAIIAILVIAATAALVIIKKRTIKP
ncbi:MAG: cohesin domain-containing protein [Candidatus Bathyarchaeia archaeon]|jgi:hypothetical protein